MRDFTDAAGRRWVASNAGDFGVGQPGDGVEVDTRCVLLSTDGEMLTCQIPIERFDAMSDAEFAQTVEYLLAKRAWEQGNQPAREITDDAGTIWLVTVEGLPSKAAGVAGSDAVRFISWRGTRYLQPVPPNWERDAEANLRELLKRASYMG